MSKKSKDSDFDQKINQDQKTDSMMMSVVDQKYLKRKLSDLNAKGFELYEIGDSRINYDNFRMRKSTSFSQKIFTTYISFFVYKLKKVLLFIFFVLLCINVTSITNLETSNRSE